VRSPALVFSSLPEHPPWDKHLYAVIYKLAYNIKLNIPPKKNGMKMGTQQVLINTI